MNADIAAGVLVDADVFTTVPAATAVPANAFAHAHAGTRAPMGGAPGAVPMPIMPAPAGSVIPVPARPVPAGPGVPPAAVPEHGATTPPAIVVRAGNPHAVDEYATIIDRVPAVAGVVVVIRVARAGWVVAGPVVIGRPADIYPNRYSSLRRTGQRNSCARRHSGAQCKLQKILHSTFLHECPLDRGPCTNRLNNR